MLRDATTAEELPGVVALAATHKGIVYEGVFGRRRLNGGPAMTRDTVFRVASMIKPIISVAALQLVEQDKLSLDAPVPTSTLRSAHPKCLTDSMPQESPVSTSKGPILLRHLLTHTAGFTYRSGMPKPSSISRRSIGCRQPTEKGAATPLMFDPGERWQYSPVSIGSTASSNRSAASRSAFIFTSIFLTRLV